jgi:hypothetical protein
MSDPSPYLSHYHRYLFPDEQTMIVLGDASGIWRGREAYHRTLRIDVPDDPSDTRVRRLLASAGLAALTLHDRESWGWTVTLPGLPVGLFCGVEPDGRLCGTVREADATRAVAVLQRQKAGGALVQSHIEPPATDPLATVREYFDRVVQTPTRLVLDDEGPSVLVQLLPDGARDGLLSAPDDELRARCESLRDAERLHHLEEVLLFYACRCSDEMILEMLTKLPEKDREEIWRGQSALTIECPRCGRAYHVQRGEA